jgi:hypothetical protein
MRTLWAPADIDMFLPLEEYARTLGWTGSSTVRRAQEHRCPIHAGMYVGVRTGRPSLRETG